MEFRLLYAPLLSGIRLSLLNIGGPPHQLSALLFRVFEQIVLLGKRKRGTHRRIRREKTEAKFALLRIVPSVEDTPDHCAAQTPALAHQKVTDTCWAIVFDVLLLIVS